MNIRLFSSFPEAAMAREAVQALRSQGAKLKDLTALYPESSLSEKPEALSTKEMDSRDANLAAITSRPIPGLGLASGGSAILASLEALAESSLGLTVTGEIARFLEGQGLDSHLARKTEKALKRGASVVLVDCPTGALVDIRVRDILLRNRASLVSRSASERLQLVCQPG